MLNILLAFFYGSYEFVDAILHQKVSGIVIQNGFIEIEIGHKIYAALGFDFFALVEFPNSLDEF